MNAVLRDWLFWIYSVFGAIVNAAHVLISGPHSPWVWSALLVWLGCTGALIRALHRPPIRVTHRRRSPARTQ